MSVNVVQKTDRGSIKREIFGSTSMFGGKAVKETLLLVEDNPHIMLINSDFLKDCGYTIIEAETVAEAIQKFNEKRPDLIVMDIMLPDGDGVELCEKIRQGSRVPVLFLSAKDGNESIIEGLNRGGDDYLTKPYDMFVLLARIEALLRRVGNSRDYIFRYGCIELDQQMKHAYINGEIVNLAQKEFLMLLYFAKNADRQVPKEEIYKAVWGQELGSDSAALWTAISRLKKKLEPFAPKITIETERTGYRLFVYD